MSKKIMCTNIFIPFLHNDTVYFFRNELQCQKYFKALDTKTMISTGMCIYRENLKAQTLILPRELRPIYPSLVYKVQTHLQLRL